MMGAPLVMGNDLRELQNGSKKSDAILKIVTNENLIRVDQDSLVKPAKRIARKGTIDILARPLSNGDIALCFFNMGRSKKEIEFDLASLKDEKYLNISRIGKAQIKNLWSEEIFHSDTIKTSVASHDVKVFRISNL